MFYFLWVIVMGTNQSVFRVYLQPHGTAVSDLPYVIDYCCNLSDPPLRRDLQYFFGWVVCGTRVALSDTRCVLHYNGTMRNIWEEMPGKSDYSVFNPPPPVWPSEAQVDIKSAPRLSALMFKAGRGIVVMNERRGRPVSNHTVSPFSELPRR